MSKAPKARMNLYVSPDVKEKTEKYAEENFMSISACVNMILKSYFDGRELLSESEQMNSALASLVTAYRGKVED